MPSKLRSERRGAVTIIAIDRPEARNAIDAETASLLAEAIETFGRDHEARVLVVAGAGRKAFCAGADLNDIERLVGRPRWAETGPLGFSGLEPGKPRIAAIEGYCVGGGVELACWCDLRIAGREALFGALNRRFGVPWVDGGTQRLPRIVGLGNALYLLESGELVDAERALAMGLVQEVVPAGGALDRAVELAERIAAYPQASLLADRANVLDAIGRDLDRGLRGEAERGLPTAADPAMAEEVRRFLSRRKRPGGWGRRPGRAPTPRAAPRQTGVSSRPAQGPSSQDVITPV
jgi:enoyl-CoA hydratase